MPRAGPSTPAITPSHAEIERAIRRAARDLLNSDPDHVTVNRARQTAIDELGLDARFFKDDARWKRRSKSIVEAVVNDDDAEEAAEPEKPGEAGQPQESAKSAVTAGTKRKSSETATRPRKKARQDAAEDGVSGEAMEDSDESEAKPAERWKKSALSCDAAVSDEEDPIKSAEKPPKTESDVSARPNTEETAPRANGAPPHPEDDDSDMSVLIDEPPKKTGRKKSAAEPKAKRATKSCRPPKTATGKSHLSPAEEEIKRLQGWLVKCGLRKVWSKELASCPTHKDKIKHLKKMLEDAGMTGRYSNDKASEIKDARELAAELEAARDFANRWGHVEEDSKGRPRRGTSNNHQTVPVSEDDETEEQEQEQEREEAKPARRLPKGFVDFGDSGSEESDLQ